MPGHGLALPRYTLATYITAELLEIGQAHACHRFVLEDAETDKAELLVSVVCYISCSSNLLT